ncbi:hypothetical protein [Psilogramma increta granulovirus]|uniref:RING-type domain-containing protein n=1 Tax=Psilogramma increta granulovirus TaxID=2953508 RepID=A0A977TNL5_9BBAC|nr:hypothetical protein [Psilogramma increta granulovirus]
MNIQLYRHCIVCETTYRVRQDGCTDPLAMMDCGHYYCRQCILDTDTCYMCDHVTKNKFYVRHNQVWCVAPVIKKCVLPNTKLLNYDLICLLVRFNNLTTTNFIIHQCCIIDPPTRQTPHSKLCPWNHSQPSLQIQTPSILLTPSIPQQTLLPILSQQQPQRSLTIEPSTSFQKKCNCIAGHCLCVVSYNSNNNTRNDNNSNNNNNNENNSRAIKRAFPSTQSIIVIDSDNDDNNNSSAVYNNKCVKKRKTQTTFVTEYYDSDSDDEDRERAPPPNPTVVKAIIDCMKQNTKNLARMQSVSIEMRTSVENFLAIHPQYDTNTLYQFIYDKFCHQSITNTTFYDLYVVLLLFDIRSNNVVDKKLQNVINLINENGKKNQYMKKFFYSCDDVLVDNNNNKCVTDLCDTDDDSN